MDNVGISILLLLSISSILIINLNNNISNHNQKKNFFEIETKQLAQYNTIKCKRKLIFFYFINFMTKLSRFSCNKNKNNY
ncbi:hypothetical protein DERF_014900 [Dermatophagoides farinae]|uniref:Transmembrane protein n=1 Tax=Dermatophagoides farinae TaxID=6954 RepID=A0A922HNC0_DERFA|nr:hypothetical protein DERF_014900 [Dermatophagoides farinae]